MTLKPRSQEAAESHAGIERGKQNHVSNIQRDTRRNGAEVLATDLSSLPQIDETGEVRIGRIVAIGLSKYATTNGLTTGTLMRLVEEAGIQPIGFARNGNRTFQVYPKSEVERLPHLTLPVLHVEIGEVTIRGKKCVSVSLYALRNELPYQTLDGAIQKAKLQPFGQALSRGKIVDVFRRDEIESLPYIKNLQQITDRVNEKGEVRLKGKLCVGLSAFAKHRGISVAHLMNAIAAEGISPFGKAQSLGRATFIDVFLKSEIDTLTIVQNSYLPTAHKDGTVQVGREMGVVIDRYAKTQNLDPTRLLRAIQESGLRIIGNVRGKSGSLDVYRLSEVQKLAFVQNAKKREKVVHELNDAGEVKISGIWCIGVSKWADAHGRHPTRLQEAIDAARLKPIGKARNHSRIVDVYEKATVEKLDYVLQKPKELPQLPDSGEVKIGRIQGIVISKYAEVLGMSFTPLQNAIQQAQLEPIGQATSYTRVVDVYPKKLVDALPIVKEYSASEGNLDENGEILIRGKTCIGIAKYAASINRGHKEIKEAVMAAKLRPMGKAMSKNRIIDVYEKSAVEALPYFTAIARVPNDKGEVDIDGISGIAVAKFSQAHGLNFTTVKNEIIEAGLRPIGKARSGTVMVDVYAKSEILRLPYIMKRLGGVVVNDPDLIREQLKEEARKLKIPLDELLDPDKVRQHIRKSSVLHALLRSLAELDEQED